MAGTRSTTEAAAVAPFVDIGAAFDASPAELACAVAETLANQRGGSLADVGLRLFDAAPSAEVFAAVAGAVDVHQMHGPDLIGQVYAARLDTGVRRRRGTHLTARAVADRLVSCLDPDWTAGDTVPRVLDPSVGGAAFLLAAADALVDAGREPIDVWAALRGVDIDVHAVAVAESALSVWLIGHGAEPRSHPDLVVGDGLLEPLPTADVVVGNPPFLTQLRRASAASAARRAALREHWSPLVGAYTDEAWLFLAAAVEAVAPGGQVTLVQPVSMLAARDGSPIRRRLHELAELTGIWVADGRVFDASVEVCAPILRRRHMGESGVAAAGAERGDRPVRRWSGASFDVAADSAAVEPDAWGRVASPLVGTPAVVLDRSSGSLADVATATAGFRDQFYGLAEHVVDGTPSDADASPSLVAATDDPQRLDRLVTVGMIDPLQLRWGSASFRFAGRRLRSPLVDRASLEQADPALFQWVEARRRPKVLVATQTRIIEPWADVTGFAVPATPVISVEPHDPNDVPMLYLVLVALLAPQVSADRAAAGFGTALSVRALKLAARDLLEIPLPIDKGAWHAAAELLTEMQRADRPATRSARFELGQRLARAHGGADRSVVEWWIDRWPNR